MPKAYYNEIDPYCAEWLRNLISANLIAPGEVDTRDIRDVRAVDLAGFTQCHFFAGLGGWSRALRLAAWPDHRQVWTGSCPCQPFSVAGARRGFADDRHLWPCWHWLIEQCRPAVVLGEQVAGAAAWLRLVRGDLEALGYAVGAIPVEAASAGADHLRDRYWFVGHGGGARLAVGPLAEDFCRDVRHEGPPAAPAGTGEFEWVLGADGKCRRVKPGIRLLAHGVPARVAKLRAFGNAIDPRPAQAFVESVMDILK